RTIAIPDAGRRAGEGLSGRNDGGCRQKQKAHRLLLLATDAVAIPIEMGAVAGLPPTDRGSSRGSCFRAVAPCPIGGRSGSQRLRCRTRCCAMAMVIAGLPVG